jgi:ABC-2 type transport system permease protein
MNIFLIPLWLLSGAAFPASGAQGWLKIGMAANPVSYGVAAVRRALYAGEGHSFLGVPSFTVALAITTAFAALMLGVSVWVARGRTASHG